MIKKRGAEKFFLSLEKHNKKWFLQGILSYDNLL